MIGTITNVSDELVGSVLTAAAASGATSIYVADPEEFDWDGGQLELEGGEILTYTVPEDSEGELELATPLAADYDEDAVVRVYPYQSERIASIIEPGGDEEIDVLVPHQLVELLATGTRDEDDAEVVQAEFRGDELVIADVQAQEPTRDGSFIDPDTLPEPEPGPITDGDPPDISPAVTLEGGPGFLAATWEAIANADPVTYEVHLSTMSGFTPDSSTLAGQIDGTLAFMYAEPDGTPLEFDTTYYCRLIAKDLDGAAAPGVEDEAEIIRVPGDWQTDGDPPASSPAAAVTGGPRFLAVGWDAISNADPVTYEVHLSTSTGFTPDAATLVAETPATSIIVDRDGDGDPLAYDTTYYVRLVAKDGDGAAAEGAQGSDQLIRLPSDEQDTDGDPPASSPTPNVDGGPTFLFARWTPITNADPVTYEVHISTSTGFTPGPGTLFAATPASSIIIDRTAGGGALALGTTYYVKIVAKDADGSAAASSQDSASLVALPSSFQTTDGAAPASSPAATVEGAASFLYVRWTPVANNDPVTYEVHISTTTGFTPNAGTKFGETAGASMIVNKTAGGSALAAGTTYFVKLIAKDADGSAAAGTQGSASLVALPSSAQASDGAAPASSPTPTFQGGIGIIALKWTPVANNDPVTYEVHLSTSTGFTPGAGTLVGETAAGSFVVRKTAAGAALAYATTYYAKIVAKDADGSASASAQASGQLVQATGTDDIAAATITAANIAANTITANEIAADAITASELAANAVTANEIQAGAVVAGKIAADAVTATEIAAGTITASEIAANTITAAEIAADAVTASEIAANTVTAAEIAANTITAGQIAANTITANEIAADAITASELAANAVTATEIQAGAISVDKLVVGGIAGHNVLPDSSFESGVGGTVALGTGTTRASSTARARTGTKSIIVTTPGTVTAEGIRFANGASAPPVEAGKTYSFTAYARGAGILRIRLIWLTSGIVQVGSTVSSSPVTVDDTAWHRITLAAQEAPATAAYAYFEVMTNGTQAVTFYVDDLQMEEGGIPTAYTPFNSRTGITANEIAANTIVANNIAALTITGAEIAANAITASKILAGTITATEIAATTILAGNIASNAITSAKILAGAVTADKLTVSTLSAITADMGTLTAGTIRGGIVETQSANPKVRMDTTGVFATDASGNKDVHLTTSGLNLIASTSATPAASRRVDWLTGSTRVAGIYGWDDTAGSGRTLLRGQAGTDAAGDRVNIIRDDGVSSFLRVFDPGGIGANTETRKALKYGSVAINVAGAASGTATVTHGFTNKAGSNVAPNAVLVTIASDHVLANADVHTIGTAQFTIRVKHRDAAATFPAGSTVTVHWIAIGG